MNTALARAQQALHARQALRQNGTYVATATSRHQPLQLAYLDCGHGIGGPMLYLLVRYCPACLRGHTVDLIRDLPVGVPRARSLKLKQQRPWRLECLA